MTVPSLTPAALVTVAANAVAVAVAFGAQLSAGQQEALLTFVGSVSTLLFAIYAAVHVHHVSSAVKLQSSQSSQSAPPVAGGV